MIFFFAYFYKVSDNSPRSSRVSSRKYLKPRYQSPRVTPTIKRLQQELTEAKVFFMKFSVFT